jgi:hypothetical protein
VESRERAHVERGVRTICTVAVFKIRIRAMLLSFAMLIVTLVDLLKRLSVIHVQYLSYFLYARVSSGRGTFQISFVNIWAIFRTAFLTGL